MGTFNLDGSWDGLTGLEVREGLANAINSKSSKAETVSGITFQQNELNQSLIDYSIVNANGTVIASDSFSVSIPVSGYNTTIYNFDAPSYITPGESATISFEFKIEHDNTLISGYRLLVELTVNNQKLPYFTTNTSYGNQNKRCSYTIAKEWLREGINEVVLSARPIIDGAIGSPATIDNDTKQISCFSARINGGFKTTSGGYDVEKVLYPNVNTTIVLNALIVDGQNSNIPSKYTESSVDWIVYNSEGVKLQSSDISTITSSISIATLTGISNASYVGECKFYLQGVVTIGTNKIYTNVIAYCLIVKDGNTHVSYRFDDFKGYQNNGSNYNIEVNSIPLTYTQYDKLILSDSEYFQNNESKSSIYIYSPVDDTISFKFSDDSKAASSPSFTANTDSLQTTHFEYDLKTSGEKYFAIISNTSGTLVTLQLNINAISNDLVVPEGAILSLTSNGKSGNDTEWASGIYSAILDGFNFSSNGWLENALVVNNDASVVIPIAPFDKVIGDGLNNTVQGRTISIRFKTSVDNPTEELIRCVLKNLNGVSQADGFLINSQKAILYKGNSSVQTAFDSNEIKEITFVWYNTQYGNISIIYVNGTSQVVLEEGTSIAQYSNIIINSVNTQLYLYDINIFNRALTFSEVQALYISNKAKDVSAYIINNAIFNSSITIGNNGQKVTPESLPVGSTYMLIKAFKGNEGPDKPWEVINQLNSKENNKETKSWNVLAGETYLITKVAQGLTPSQNNFYADRIAFSGQGTSSMAYPIKNFRIYFNKKLTWKDKTGGYPWNTDVYGDTNWNTESTEFKNLQKTSLTLVFVKGSDVTGIDFHPQSGDSKIEYSINNNIPAQTFCLKADFAESSGMHNTGFARLADYALESSKSITYELGDSNETKQIKDDNAHLPHNRYYNNEKNEYIYRSTIDGIQVYLFFADKSDNIYYHGKYNFNYDKADASLFGFEPYDKDNDVYFSQINNEAQLLSNLFGTTLQEFGQGHSKIKGTDIINPTECWEFSTNNPNKITHYDTLSPNYLHQIGAFTFPYNKESGFPYYNQLGGNTFDPFTETVGSGDDAGKLAWINTEQAWEPRYPDEDEITEYYENGGTPYLLKSLYKWVHRNNVYCRSNESKEVYAGYFALNLDKYFNVDYLVKYYVLTKLFINADQRIKNCMLAFYFDPNVESNEGNTTGTQGCPMGHMRAYYIFYDNDTILGVDNDGNLTNPWNSDEIATYFPSGIRIDNTATVNYTEDSQGNKHVPYHGIWGNLEYCYSKYLSNTSNTYIKNLGQKIEKAYLSLRLVLTDGKIYEYLNSALPDSADNVDLEVKYLYPTTLNHRNGLSNFYGLNKYQGNRKYHREWLLNKRTKWLDSRYGAGSITNYYLMYKVLGTSGFANQYVSLLTSIDKWRFYIDDSEGNSVKSELCYITDGGSGKPATVILHDTSNVNSYERKIQGLYAARTIDFSNYNNDSTNYAIEPLSNDSLQLLNVKTLIIGNANTPVNYFNNSILNFFTSGEKVVMPNLETLKILNTRQIRGTEEGLEAYNASNSFSLDLSKYTKLSSIDTSNTLADIVLPSGSSLTSLKMQRPTRLEFVDKTNLNSIIISDKTSLDTLTANTCNNYTYAWVLNEYISRKRVYDSYVDQNQQPVVKVSIIFNDTKNELSSDVIELLLQLASQNNPGLSVSGEALYTALTEEEASILSLNTSFSELTIITQYSDEFNFIFSSGTELRENSELGIGCTLNVDSVDSWDIEWINSGDQNILSNYVHILQRASKRCIIKADPIWDNTEIRGSFKIKATHGGETLISDQIIYISYIPIRSVKLTTVNNIVRLGITNINVDVNSDTTKLHLLTEEAVNQHNFSHNVVTYPAAQSCTISYNDGMTLMYSPNNDVDSEVTLTLGSSDIKGKIMMYFDKVICTKNDVENNSTLSWIRSLLLNQWDQLFVNSSNIYRSTLHKYKISTANGTISRGSNSIPSWDQENNNVTYDLTNLLYFDCDSRFIIPYNFEFSDLYIPEGITHVDWTSPILGTTFGGYGTIMFPSTINTVYVNLSGLTDYYPNLTFDLTKAKNITRIYKAPLNASGLLQGDFGLYMSYNQYPNVYQQEHSLFNYYQETVNGLTVGSIKQIGVFKDTIGTSIDSPSNGMFDIAGQNFSSQDSPTYSPLYYLGYPICDPVNKLKVGCISNYRMSTEALDWSAVSSNVVGLSYTFYKGSGLSNDLTLNNITFIGDGTFYEAGTSGSTELTLGGNVSTFGCSAFREFKGTINSTGTLSKVEENVSVTLGNYAFAMMESNYSFKFNATSIGEYAITGDGEIQNLAIDVHLLNTTEPTITRTPFGKIVDLYVKSNIETWARNTLTRTVKSITVES